jgi:predicted  nucleic acid-binding Zn-ribbon protein
MKAICVLLVLALAVFGARAEEQVLSQEVAAVAQEGAVETMPEVDMAIEEDEAVEEDEALEEDEDEALEEDEAEDEMEAEDEAEFEIEDEDQQEDEIEGEDEFETEDEEEVEQEDEAEEEESDEFSLLEAQADAEDEALPPRRGARRSRRRRGLRAPVAIKARPFKFHSERIHAQTSKNEDPEMAKLDLALAAVKEDILSTNKQITDERKWVIAVAKIIASYNDKMKRVESHIIALRKEMKQLYRKKKQIENLKLQKALEAKLKEARDELATLTGSLKHVQVKQGELNKSGTDLRQTIAGIQAQLAKLRGQQVRKPKPAPRKCGKGKRYSKKARKCVARKSRRLSRTRRNKRRAARKL